MRIDTLDDLAVELHDQAQHPVRGRVLGSEVDRVIADLLVAGIARMAEIAARPLRSDIDLDGAAAGAGVGHGFFLRGFLAAGFFSVLSDGASAAGAGDGAPGASPFAFSSPGSTYSGPSHGIRKSKVRKSCGNATGS